MNLGQACRPCRGSCSLIPGRGCFGDLHGDEIVVSPPSPIVEPLAAAEQLSNTLLSYSHHDWEQAQPANPLCDATRRYIKPGYPNPPPLFLCAHLPSHTRPETADIAGLAAKGHLLQGDDNSTLLVQQSITAASAPDGQNGRRILHPFDDPIRIYVPLLARPSIMHAYHADTFCHLGVTRTLKMLESYYWWVGMEVCTKWWVRRCLKCLARKTSRQTIRWPTLSIPLPNSPGISVSVDYFGPLPITARRKLLHPPIYGPLQSASGYVRCNRRGIHS